MLRSDFPTICLVFLAIMAISALGLSVYHLYVLLIEQRLRRRQRALLLRRVEGEVREGVETETTIAFSVMDVLTPARELVEKSWLWQRVVQPRLMRRREATLREACVNDLPEMVDMLALAMSAGLSFDQALERYVAGFDTALAREFAQAMAAYQVGMCSRVRAFEDVAQRVGEEAVLRFVACVRQAATLGSSLATSFEVLSFEVRRYRKARLEERIAKTPVKLLVPLGLCILPAVLLLLMGPVIMQVLSGLSL